MTSFQRTNLVPTTVSGLVVTLKHEPGSLASVLSLFNSSALNMCKIVSHPSSAVVGGYDIAIDVDASDDAASFEKLIDDLNSLECVINIVQSGTTEIPWFPTMPKDLDLFNLQTMEYGAELDADHPGFNDEAYRERRREIVENANTYKYGEPIPRVDYTEEELTTWGIVWDKLTELYPTHACKQFNQIFPLLEQCGYSRDNIPQLQDVTDFLRTCTGFSLRPVQGLLTPRDFLNGLAFRVFHSTQYIRHHSQPLYTPEPDVCHELLGHVPLLADPDFAEFSQEIGLASLGASDDDITRLATLYWFTVEFGLCREGDSVKAYGAGLLSSFGELQYCLTDEPEVRPLKIDETCEQEYPITRYQPIYFLAKDFKSMTNDVRYFSQNRLNRPFAVHFDPWTQRVITLNNKNQIMSLMNNIRSEMAVLGNALELNL